MRQGQQNRRGRGRGRKPQNPLSRNYESNGPDVKIRGTAAHIAEKYVSLARDALSSGDIVTAENYLQHAEHYNRIVAASQAQMHSQATEQVNGSGGPVRVRRQQTDQPVIAEDEEAETPNSGDTQIEQSTASAPTEPEQPKPRRRRSRATNGSGSRNNENREEQATVEANRSEGSDIDNEPTEAPDGAIA